MKDNATAMSREAGSPSSELVETPGNVRGDRGWLGHFQFTTPLIISQNTSASDLFSSFELIPTLIIGNSSDKKGR